MGLNRRLHIAMFRVPIALKDHKSLIHHQRLVIDSEWFLRNSFSNDTYFSKSCYPLYSKEQGKPRSVCHS